MEPLALAWGLAKRFGGLPKIVLQQPRFRQRAPQLQHVVSDQPGLLQRPNEQGRGLGAVAPRQRVGRLPEKIRRGGWTHAAQYSWYTADWIEGLQNCPRAVGRLPFAVHRFICGALRAQHLANA